MCSTLLSIASHRLDAMALAVQVATHGRPAIGLSGALAIARDTRSHRL